MRNTLLALTAVAMFASVPAIAQEGTAAGVAGGAATGAVIGGPVGAVIGAGAGAVLGTAIDPPPDQVRTYVLEQDTPSVVYEGEIVVGEPLPETVIVQTVPEYDTYGYAVVNDQRVILEPGTRRVIQIVE